MPGDITVTDSGIINAAIGNDTFSHIQVVNLSGDSGANHIDATDFTGFSVVSGGGGADVINGASVLIHPLGLTFSSTDGDAVSVKLTKGSLDATDVLLTPNAALTGADLQLLDFHGDQAFNGTKIKITAKHTATGGDGFFDLGNIDATGINLGAVTIPGDLGHISAGHGNSTGFALASLTVHSLGVRASFAQSAGGSLESDLVGKVGPIKISGDVDEASIRVTGGASPALGSIASVSIGGDLVGGDQAFSGAITASGKIGSVSIKGTMFGGLGQYSGSILTSDGASIGSVSAGSIVGGSSDFEGIFSDGQLGPVKIKGGINGTENSRVTISATGLLNPGPHKSPLAIASINVGGAVHFTDFLAGYATDGTGVNADVQIGAVTIGGDWIATNLVAGVLADGGGFGTPGDTLIPGGNATTSKIAAVIIKGQALGQANSFENFGIVAQQLRSVKIGATSVHLQSGSSNDTDADPARAVPGAGCAGGLNAPSWT